MTIRSVSTGVPAASVRAACANIVLVAAVTSCLAGQAFNQPQIGAGLNGVSDWSRTNEFNDLVKQSRRFGSASAPWDENTPVDANGWPTGDAGIVLMCCQLPGPALAGTYKIRLRCNATPTITPVASPGTVSNVVRDAATGIVTADYINPPSGTQIFLSFRNTSGGIRDLSVMRPGQPADQPMGYSPQFLAHNARFSTVRFMDWLRTNDNETTSWSQRTLLDDATWCWRSGVPYEACADVCNALARDMWINVPAKADDNYARQMARVIRDRLNPALNVYVEYSNETWNWGFSQATWNLQQALAEVAAGSSDLAYDGATDQNWLRWRRHARETVRVGKIFAEEFGQGSMNTRVRPVLAGQLVYPDQYRESLKYISTVMGPPKDRIYAMAGAPYFNMGTADSQTNLTPSQVLDALSASVDANNASLPYETLAAYSAWWGLHPMMAYEGGPDTFGPNNIAAKRAASFDPRMREIAARHLRGWFAAGGGLHCWFVSGAGDWNSQYGTWTLTEDMAVQNTPKIQAIDDVLSGPPIPLTAGQRAPGIIDARLIVQRPSDWATRPGTGIRNTNEYVDYLVRSDYGGKFQARVRAAAWAPAANFGFAVNGVNQGSVILPRTGTWGNTNYTWSITSASVTLPAGLSTLRLKFLDSYSSNVTEIELAGCTVADLASDSSDQNRSPNGFIGSDLEAFINGLMSDNSQIADIATDPSDVYFNPNGSVGSEDIEAFINSFIGGCS